jgi:hypothetical protein
MGTVLLHAKPTRATAAARRARRGERYLKALMTVVLAYFLEK